MTREHFEATIDQRLAEFRAKLVDQKAFPVLCVGCQLGKGGRFVVHWAGEKMTLEETYRLLSAMQEQVAEQLGIK